MRDKLSLSSRSNAGPGLTRRDFLRLAGLAAGAAAAGPLLSACAKAAPPNLLARLYVTNEGDGVITAIDTTTNTVLATIAVGDQPHHGTITHDGQYLFIGNRGADYISVIDCAALKEVKQIKTGAGPAHPAVSHNGQWLATDNSADTKVTLIDIATLEVVGHFPGAQGEVPYMEHVSWSPDDRYFYAGNIGGGTLMVVDMTARTVAKEIPTRGTHHNFVNYAREGGRYLWTLSERATDGKKAVVVLDIQNDNQVAAEIDLPDEGPDRPMEMHHGTFSADGKYVYLCNRGVLRNTTSVYVVDTQTFEVVKQIQEGKSPHHALRSPDDKYIYVTGMKQDYLLKIDAASNEVVGKITTVGPQGINNPYQEHFLFSQDGARLYVLNTGDKYIAVIDTASEKVIATIPVGSRAHHLIMVGMPDYTI